MPETSLSVLNLIVQGGSFALLAYIIVYGLPQLHRLLVAERKEERVEFAQALREATATFQAESEANRAIFRDEVHAERVACERHFEALAGAMSRGHETTMAAIATITAQGHGPTH